MVSTPYNRGRAREYQALRILRDKGWVCSRTAMSHGPVDIFAAKKGMVLLIQVKSGRTRLGRKGRDMLTEWAEAFDAKAELWTFRKRGILEKKVIYSPRRRRGKASDS